MNLRHGCALACRFVLAALLLGPWLRAAADEAVDCPPAAQMPSPEQVQAGMKAARDRGFLWRIRKDGHSSYLYGTVHVARADWMYPGPALVAALHASDVVALELDLQDPHIVQRLQKGMAWRPDHAVSQDLAERLKRQLHAACLSDQLLTAISPEMLATTLTIMAGRRVGLDPAYGIDMAIASLGRGLRKPVASLETPELQLDLLQGRTPEETRAIVEQALDELESDQAAPMLTRIAQLWSDGRFDQLQDYEHWCDCIHNDEERALYHRMLDDRNPGLAQQIDALHASGKRVFAAVGSLHMIGPRGLPALLERRGYQVERVAFQ